MVKNDVAPEFYNFRSHKLVLQFVNSKPRLDHILTLLTLAELLQMLSLMISPYNPQFNDSRLWLVFIRFLNLAALSPKAFALIGGDNRLLSLLISSAFLFLSLALALCDWRTRKDQSSSRQSPPFASLCFQLLMVLNYVGLIPLLQGAFNCFFCRFGNYAAYDGCGSGGLIRHLDPQHRTLRCRDRLVLRLSDAAHQAADEPEPLRQVGSS